MKNKIKKSEMLDLVVRTLMNEFDKNSKTTGISNTYVGFKLGKKGFGFIGTCFVEDFQILDYAKGLKTKVENQIKGAALNMKVVKRTENLNIRCKYDIIFSIR